MDPAGRLSALSLVTGKQKVLLRIDEGDPRSLYFDPASRYDKVFPLFISIDNLLSFFVIFGPRLIK